MARFWSAAAPINARFRGKSEHADDGHAVDFRAVITAARDASSIKRLEGLQPRIC